jgi:tetraacyldisaccharide 4'-kinase
MNTRALVLMMPFSTLYRAVTEARAAAYRSGVFKTTSLPASVISVGNITTGGTGKTPLVEWVCRTIASEGIAQRVCVLTRGYGKENPHEQVLVSDGFQVLATEREAGDEPLLLANSLRGVAAVISNPDRVAAGRWAIENLGADAFVLDDGFQHLRIARDLDIVTIDATNPFGGGELLPNGRLRETPKSLARADCIVMTRCDHVNNVAELSRQVQRFADDTPIFSSRMELIGFRELSGEPAADAEVRATNLGAFCGVGNPESFFELLKRTGLNVVFTRRFPDHHGYSPADLDALVTDAQSHGANALITTAKDAVKLRPNQLNLRCFVLDISIVIENEAELATIITKAIRQRSAK